MNMGVDLGDGTYAVRFVRNGVTSYVRVDGDLSVGNWNWGLAFDTPGVNGNLWGSLFEKAYAFFRTGQNSYSSLNWGFPSQTFADLGVASTAVGTGSGDSAILNFINTTLSAGRAMASTTGGAITGGAPVIASHVYTVVAAYRNIAGTVLIQLRNPWGVDGAGNDGVDDGLVTLTYAQFTANFGGLNYALV
jgi:hypothetical protein